MTTTERPRPAGYDDHRPFWDGAAAGRLVVQRCTQCGAVRWPPRILCGACLSPEVEWVEATPTGSLFTWTVIHHTTLAGFKDDPPYAVGLVEVTVAGGLVRMLGGIRGCAPSELQVGMALRAQFEVVDDGALVNWVLVGDDERQET